jgi:hypothetical protein
MKPVVYGIPKPVTLFIVLLVNLHVADAREGNRAIENLEPLHHSFSRKRTHRTDLTARYKEHRTEASRCAQNLSFDGRNSPDLPQGTERTFLRSAGSAQETT